ncbi:MAG: linear amide C-N hydrolase [Spirochaetales bacterium]|nr:linear amide C-N hydrolase [Spirochaetales bacterium]
MDTKWLIIPVSVLALCSCLISYLFSFKAELEEVSRETGLDVIRFVDKEMGVDFIDYIHIGGTHFELGCQLGMLAKKTVVRPKICEPNARELNKRIIAMYENLYPAYLEELKGIAKAFDMNMEDMDLRFMEREFFVNLGWLGLGFAEKKHTAFKELGALCSIVACNSDVQGKKKTIVGRNFDWLQPNGAVVRAGLSGDYKTLGSTIICLEHWIMDGINEKGLFIGVLTVATPERESYAGLAYPDSPAVDAHHMMRIILNTCASVREAAALTEKTRIWFGDDVVHLLLADASGAMCVFEFDSQGRLFIVSPDEKKYLVSTNSWLYGTIPSERRQCWRYEFAGNELEQKKLHNLDDLFEVMKKISIVRSNPHARNKMAENDFDYLQTVWTSLYDLEQLSMKIHYWLDGKDSFYFYSIDR